MGDEMNRTFGRLPRIGLALAGLLLCLLAAQAAQAQWLAWDVNRDGVVNVVDVQTTVNLILGTAPPTYSMQGDVNSDTAVNVVDVQEIVNIVLNGLPPPPPSPPGFASSPPGLSVTAGGSWSYVPVLSGGPYPTLTLLAGAPSWVTLNNAGGGTVEVRATPSISHIGPHTFTLVASNGNPPDATQTINLQVEPPPSTAPTITTTPPTTANAGTLYTYTPNVTGYPTPTLSFGPNKPAWLNLIGGLVYGTPSNNDMGAVSVTIIASNNVQPDATQTWTIIVTGTPVPPSITGNPPATVEYNNLWTYTPTVTGAPTPTLSLNGAAPLWVQVTGNTISGIPSLSDVGTNQFTIIASNGNQPDATQAVTVTVTNSAAPMLPTWSSMTITGAPSARTDTAAVFNGTEMVVWGGQSSGVQTNTGGRYNPVTDTWTPTSTVGAPQTRSEHTLLLAGSRIIVWGGLGPPISINPTLELNTGAMYSATTDSWIAMTNVGAPSARRNHTAIWTGTQMVVWGGRGGSNPVNTGGVFGGTTGSWTATSTVGSPGPRYAHTAVWTGTHMIVWGGYGTGIVGPEASGGIYDPVANTWSPVSNTNSPSPRYDHTAVWTGTRMIVWGGTGIGGPLNDGASYDPVTNTWTPLATNAAPTARTLHTAVWTGTRMVVWGGRSGNIKYNDGGIYDPANNSWLATPSTGAPIARDTHVAVWSPAGNQMVVWGGNVSTATSIAPTTNTGGRLVFP